MKINRFLSAALALLITAGTGTSLASVAGPESKRLAKAKDLIAEEQWGRAVEELRAAVADEKETRKDEALYWLAHSLNQAGDSATALTTIRALERTYPTSMWVRLAGAMRLEMAMKMGRSDILWMTAAPPPPPAPPVPAPTPRPASTTRTPTAVPAPPAPAPPSTPTPTPRPSDPAKPPAPPAPAHPAPPPGFTWQAMPAAPTMWLPEHYQPDSELRVQALWHLMRTDAPKVIPILKEIALEGDNPGTAGRAVFVLAQSGSPEARETVVQVARTGSTPVRVAAVRELGRFGGPDMSSVLLTVYSTSEEPVKLQVVRTLGERSARTALLRIVETEVDRDLRTRAILTLGQAGGAAQLRDLYAKARPEWKRPIIVGLFNARAEVELIRVADIERDQLLRQEALNHLRLLGTPGAKAYLEKVSKR
jgi:outer membrane biosynthesis protein TonB